MSVKYEDILKQIQGAKSIPLEERISLPTINNDSSNKAKLKALKNKVAVEQQKYNETKQELQDYLKNSNVITSNQNQFSFYKPTGTDAYQNIAQNRVTLPYYDTRTDYEKELANQPYQFAKTEYENQQNYEKAMQSEEGQEKKKNLMEQTNALGYAKYDYAKEQVNQDEIGWYDKTIGNIGRGLASLADINNGIVYDENGETIQLPNRLELKNQKVNESYETFVGKLLGNAVYEGTRILATTALNSIAPYVGTSVYFGDMFRDSYNDVKREGYSNDKAAVYATLSTLAEVITGKILGSATKGLTGGKSGAVDTAVKKFLSKYIGDNGLSNFLANATSEGIEEFTQEFIDKFNRNLVLDTDEKIFSEETLEDAIYSGLVGAITGGTLGGNVDVNQDLKA